MRFEAEAKNSSENLRIREFRGAEMRSVVVLAEICKVWKTGIQDVKEQ